MLILGIETSCDETAAAVIQAKSSSGLEVVSNVIASQIDLHAKTGGVVPEVAAREHVVRIIPVIHQALREAGDALGRALTLDDVDAVAVTFGPGLVSSLVTGTVTASTLGKVSGKPVVPVNHIEGHLYSNFIQVRASKFEPCLSGRLVGKKSSPGLKFPILALTVSGGHNELVLMRGHGDYEVIGETLDDAAGEAFDKCARLLGLGYPGGPAIQKAAAGGDPHAYSLPRAFMTERAKHRAAMRKRAIETGKIPARQVGDFDFSFSGLKTALFNLITQLQPLSTSGLEVAGLPPAVIPDLAASLQEAICDALSERVLQALLHFGNTIREMHLAGGVSANLRLRDLVTEKMRAHHIDIPLRWPADIRYCTDNAAMIAAAGYFRYIRNPAEYRKWKPISARPNAELS